MSLGCLSCFKVKKKQSKKEIKPLKAERLPEPVGEKEDVEIGADKKIPINEEWSEWIRQDLSRVGSNYVGSDRMSGPKVDDLLGKLDAGVSSSSMNNDFHKVKTFDLRGVTEAATK